MLDFDTIYRRYWPDVLRFSLYLCGKEAEAEDLTSEAFLRAWTSTQPIRIGTVLAYLFVIVRNLHRDKLRRYRRAKPLSDDIPEPGPGLETAAAIRGELDRTLAAMQRLPESDRVVLAMAAFDAMPHELIGAALGLSVSAVKVRIHRARLKLNAVLDPQPTRNEP